MCIPLRFLSQFYRRNNATILFPTFWIAPQNFDETHLKFPFFDYLRCLFHYQTNYLTRFLNHSLNYVVSIFIKYIFFDHQKINFRDSKSLPVLAPKVVTKPLRNAYKRDNTPNELTDVVRAETLIQSKEISQMTSCFSCSLSLYPPTPSSCSLPASLPSLPSLSPSSYSFDCSFSPLGPGGPLMLTMQQLSISK